MSDKNILLFTHQMFLDAINNLSKQVENEYFAYLCAVPRGGYIAAAYLSHKLDKSIIEMSAIRNIQDVPILFVEDVVDTGETVISLRKQGVIGHLDKVACLVYKPLSIVKPDYWATTTDCWTIFEWENNKIESRPHGKKEI